MLFKTLHGSHLYGLAHEGSDTDYYVVLDKRRNARARYAKQSIVDGVDSMTTDFDTWLRMCESGVPQALEAMFAPDEMVEYDSLGSFRAGFSAGTTAHPRYFRTIRSFVYGGTYKKKRHGLRLALNLRELAETGRFHPTLDGVDKDFVTRYADKDTDAVFATAMCIAWGDHRPALL